ncbi:fusion protein [denalis virus]|uniref:Fusion glycoprotein F0 n=1 Tax=denalis virus TaxID=2940991 RepID=A0AAE9KYP4_9MONO|nr:fusion protein [denalis virus]
MRIDYTSTSIALIVLIIMVIDGSCQLAIEKLNPIGVYSVKEYEYRVTGDQIPQFLVVQLIPNITSTSSCTLDSFEGYKSAIYNLLAPVNESLTLTSTYVNPYINNKKFVAEIIAGSALALATSAQITAGIALYEARQNAAQIEAIKDSLRETNAAIQSLQTAQKQTVVAIRGLQDQINSQIVPQLNSLSCQVAGNQLRIKLLEFYTEIISIFGPILQSPLNGEVTIQALSRAAGGNLTGLLNEMGYTSTDLKNILEIKGIKGSVIDVDPWLGSLVFVIKYPTFIKVPDATIIQLAYVSYHAGSSDWMTQGPEYIMVRGYTIADIDTRSCTVGSDYLMCPQDTTRPFSTMMTSCMRGNITQCPRSLVTERDAPRFLVIKGNLVVNCVSVNCKCEDPEYSILQSPDTPLLVLDNATCKAHFIDGIRIALGPKKLPTIRIDHNLNLGPVVLIDKLDISHQLSAVEESVSESEEHLKNAVDKLDNLARLQGSGSYVIISLILSVISIAACCIMSLVLYRYINYVNNIQSNLDTIEKGPTLAPKSYQAYGHYTNQGFSTYPSAPNISSLE